MGGLPPVPPSEQRTELKRNRPISLAKPEKHYETGKSERCATLSICIYHRTCVLTQWCTASSVIAVILRSHYIRPYPCILLLHLCGSLNCLGILAVPVLIFICCACVELVYLPGPVPAKLVQSCHLAPCLPALVSLGYRAKSAAVLMRSQHGCRNVSHAWHVSVSQIRHSIITDI